MHPFFEPIIRSLQIALLSSVFILLIGTIAGKLMAGRSFRGKIIVDTLFMLPLVLPPSVVGFLLIIAFGKKSYIGQAIEELFGRSLIFTWEAAVIAATVVAFPLMYQSAKSGFSAVEKQIEEAARIDGASEWRVFLLISVPLSYKALLAGIILSFARALGEFGATLMFAGNIPGKTQTLPTAIYVALDTGDMALAWMWVIATIFLSFLMLILSYFIK